MRSATRALYLVVTILAFVPSALAQSPSPRMSLTKFVADPQRVASLKRGVQVMKARKPSDPTSWFYQAAIHGVTPEALAAALAQDPAIAQVDQTTFWNQCPHRGAGSADFLLWHRAYLFYFERILRQAAGESTLSLPYWDYATDRTFPELLADPEADELTGEPTNPLFDLRREMAFMFGMFDLSDAAVSTVAAFGEERFFGPTDDEGFAGAVADADPQTKGLIESSPHDSIHFAVGGAVGNARGLMARVATAAFDPVFWIHHANIDRLWSLWDCGTTRTWGRVPGGTWLADTPWSFHDADLSVVQRARRDYLKHSTFAVRYDSDPLACTRLSDTSPAPPALLTQAAPQRDTPPARIELARSNESMVLSADVPSSRALRVRMANAQAARMLDALEPTLVPPRTLLLELRGIATTSTPSVGYEVYVNLPANQRPNRSLPSFVGTLNLFGLEHDHAGSVPVQTFNISRLARQPGFEASDVRVQIVPFDLLAARPGQSAPVRASGGVTVASVGILLVTNSVR